MTFATNLAVCRKLSNSFVTFPLRGSFERVLIVFVAPMTPFHYRARLPIMEFLPSSVHSKEICLQARRVHKRANEHKPILVIAEKFRQQSNDTLKYSLNSNSYSLLFFLILKSPLAKGTLPNLARMPGFVTLARWKERDAFTQTGKSGSDKNLL